jgi:hypothetical protein
MVAADEEDDNQQDEDKRDDPEHFYPTRCARRRSAVGLRTGVVAGAGVAGQAGHLTPPL